ncbi:MAG: hypothetical protein LBC18_13430 [Opitutaceae bacterium]|nr:hypothetical protein [Opitutaceae bacterium]
MLESDEVQRARYSGKIVEKNRERVDAILAARAMGFPLRQICAGYHVSPHTVAELERRHAVKLATLKDRLARKFGAFVEPGIDRAINEVGIMDIDKLMVSLGIAADKLQILTGEPSIIVGNGEARKEFSIESLRERLARRPVRNATGFGKRGRQGNAREGREGWYLMMYQKVLGSTPYGCASFMQCRRLQWLAALFYMRGRQIQTVVPGGGGRGNL